MPSSRPHSPIHAETLLFDLDGTLVDTAPDLAATLDAVMKWANRKPIGLEAVRNMVGDGARALLEKGFKSSGGMPSPDDFEKAFEQFLIHYEAHIADFSRPFPGLIDVLEQLREAGVTMAVCTNKFEHFSRKLLTQLNLAQYFADVIGGDSLPVKKPDAGHIHGSIERVGGRTATSVMVGDSMNDVAAAKAAGIPVVAVSFGYTTIPVRDLGADIVIDSFGELLPALRSLQKGMSA